MSKKNEIEIPLPAYVVQTLARQTSDGQELVSPVSLVTVAASRPVTLGERIRRYTSMPTLQDDLLYDEIEDEDFIEDDGLPPMSKHEDRYHEVIKRAKTRKAEKDEADKKIAIEKETSEKEAFRNRVKEAMEAGSVALPKKDA